MEAHIGEVALGPIKFMAPMRLKACLKRIDPTPMLVSASVTGKEIYDVRNTIVSQLIISTCLISYIPLKKFSGIFLCIIFDECVSL
jgi:hypothetical protein